MSPQHAWSTCWASSRDVAVVVLSSSIEFGRGPAEKGNDLASAPFQDVALGLTKTS